MAELRSAIFWVLNCPIYLLRCYTRAFCLGFSHTILSGGSTGYATSFSNSYCSAVSYTKS
ncbi:MAG: hypothetical protein ACK54J_18895 [Pseudanabaena sp.]